MSDARSSQPSPPPDVSALLSEASGIDDGGFSERVMTALPPRRAPSRMLVPAFAGAACALAYALGGRGLVHGLAIAVNTCATAQLVSSPLGAIALMSMIAIAAAAATANRA